ncbi:MAG: threonine aldolase family protein [Chloroflexota bacterium]
MIEGKINLYSDTQTRPSPAMLETMMTAQVGDEQHGLDPTVNELCERVADLLGQEAALFLPSGTMCNEIAILVHCRPGDEIYAHSSAHIITSEAGGPAALSGASVWPLDGERGIYSGETLQAAIRGGSRYEPRPRLVEVEQTANFGGGAVWSLAEIQDVVNVARANDLGLHMDGARLFNAVVASDASAKEMAGQFDSVWIDLTKGLGCAVGAVLAGSQEFVDEAWRWKQRIGGALRQAGYLAAAGLYALEHNIDRLAEDHANANRFAEIVGQHPGVKLPSGAIDTNIVFVDMSETGVSATKVRDRLEKQGINVGAMGDSLIRAVTHMDVNPEQVIEAANAFVSAIHDKSP